VAELCRDALNEFERLERLEPLRIEEHFVRLQEVLKAINGNMELMVGVLKQVTDVRYPTR